MDKDKVRELVLNEGLTITDLIDVVVEENALIGVGLITLGEQLEAYCRSLIRRV